MSIAGEVKELEGNGRTVTFHWWLAGSELESPDVRYQSPAVTYFNRKWWFVIRKTGKSHVDRAWLGTDLLTPGYEESIHFSVKLQTSDGKKRVLAREQTILEDLVKWELDTLYIPPWGGIHFDCSLRKVDSPHAPGVSRETQTEDIGFTDIFILSEEFKKLLLSGTGNDVRLKVGDKLFRAHKCVLQARSTVFAAMFSNEMAESADGSVTIEDCDPEAFGLFLQFVYSGKVDIPSVGSALGLYYAGDKYDIPRLKEISVEFMKVSFTATTVFDVISLAARHDEEELLKQAIAYFANHLKEVLLTVEWQRFLLANPIQANEMYLKVAECLMSSL